MKVTAESRGLADLDGVPCRVWEGETEEGIPVTLFVHRVALSEDQPPEVHERFGRELQEMRAPVKVRL